MLLGGVSAKSAFSKKKFFLREDFFETTLDLRKHPQQVFWFFPHFFLGFFFKKNNPHILEELRQLCAKFHDFSMKIRGETRVQSWTFLALFFRKRIVQYFVPYFFNIIIVQWLIVMRQAWHLRPLSVSCGVSITFKSLPL